MSYRACLRRIGFSRNPKRNRRLLLEQLEHRLVLDTVSWAVDADGFWDVASNWSTGSVPGPTDDVIIDGPAGAFTVTHRQNVSTIRSLQSTESLVVSGGTISTTGQVQVAATFIFFGGTLANATVVAGTSLTGTSSGGTLDNVTLNGNFELTAYFSKVRVSNGLTLNGTATLGSSSSFAAMPFDVTQMLDERGTDWNRSTLINSSDMALILRPKITAQRGYGSLSSNFSFGGGSDASVVNHGTITANTRGRISINATNFTNSRTLNQRWESER